MSYCRFQNTFRDLDDCVDALAEGETLSADEARAAERIAKLCRTYVDLYGDGSFIVIECANCGEPNHDGGKVCRECQESDE